MKRVLTPLSNYLRKSYDSSLKEKIKEKNKKKYE